MAAASLQQLMLERIQREGPITFADYMRMALYEPGYGYYVSGETKVGWEGDFYTSTDLSAFFAHCMGRQLAALWEELERPVPFVVLEQGAGRGDLARELRTWAEQEMPDLSAALDYRTQDIGVGQDATLTAHEQDLAPFVILSNELVDAFPAHLVQKYEGQLYEVYVDEQEGRLCEVLSEPSCAEVATYLDSYKVPWQTFVDGWRAEINLDALRWIANCAGLLRQTGTDASSRRRKKKRGFLLTIDYGDKARALYTPDRMYGTLACYFRHQLTNQPLLRPGAQDITAHVNFSALIDEGRGHGLHLRTFTTQRQWLDEMRIHEELEHVRQRDYALVESQRATDRGQIALLQWYNLRQRVSALTDPAGMGNFKVLIMRAG